MEKLIRFDKDESGNPIRIVEKLVEESIPMNIEDIQKYLLNFQQLLF